MKKIIYYQEISVKTSFHCSTVMKTTGKALENLRNTSDVTEKTANPIIKVNSADVTPSMFCSDTLFRNEQ